VHHRALAVQPHAQRQHTCQKKRTHSLGYDEMETVHLAEGTMQTSFDSGDRVLNTLREGMEHHTYIV
jgi:hypothetical protein